MNLGTFTKQPRERTPYTINYSSALGAPDHILQNAVSISTSDPAFTVDQITVLDDAASGTLQTRLRFFVAGGTDRTTVKVTVLASSADGVTFEDEIIFKVKDQ
jgi:hypothetical protein